MPRLIEIGGDSIILGPPPMSFSSSLHSPPLRKSGNKDSLLPAVRTRPSPPHDEVALSTSPPEEEEEAGWSKVRSTGRLTASRGFERRGVRGERRAARESYDGAPPKTTTFRNHREGESQNWRSERPEPQNMEQGRNEEREERADLLEEEDFGGGGGKEHSAAEFQAWITKMRGAKEKSEEPPEPQDEKSLENGTSLGMNVVYLAFNEQNNRRLINLRSWMSTVCSLLIHRVLTRLGLVDLPHLYSSTVHQPLAGHLVFDNFLHKIHIPLNNRFVILKPDLM
jgi:hypothetical protein